MFQFLVKDNELVFEVALKFWILWQLFWMVLMFTTKDIITYKASYIRKVNICTIHTYLIQN